LSRPFEKDFMNDVLTADDPLYKDLYDVRREAMEMGNLVEEDMNPKLSALRDRAPVQKGFLRELLALPPHQRHALALGRQGYTTFSYAACEAVFRDSQRFSSRIVHHPAAGDEQSIGILEMDGLQHRAYRTTLQPMFTKPRALTWWRDRWINDIVSTLIERMERGDQAELNLDYCARVPVHTVTRGIGMVGDDALIFREALLKSGGNVRVKPEEQRAAAQTVERMLSELVRKRRAEPQDDVVSGLIKTQIRLPNGEMRPLTDREVVFNSRLVMVAGGGTSWRQFGITLWALLTNREQLEAVKADRSLIDAAIEESVRWNTTAPVFSRLVAEQAELEGVVLPEGAVVEICIGSANRDPGRWNDPDVYDLHRPAKQHLGFGAGQHMCLGSNVARSEISAGLNALLDAFPAIRLDPAAPAPFLTGGLEQRGISALNVLLR
jgi:cytochrome P450